MTSFAADDMLRYNGWCCVQGYTMGCEHGHREGHYHGFNAGQGAAFKAVARRARDLAIQREVARRRVRGGLYWSVGADCRLHRLWP
jgi:hypothetical protein